MSEEQAEIIDNLLKTDQFKVLIRLIASTIPDPQNARWSIKTMSGIDNSSMSITISTNKNVRSTEGFDPSHLQVGKAC